MPARHSGSRRGRRRLFAVALSAFCALLLLDVVLRLFPELPGQRLANAVWSRYGGYSGGIYAKEPLSRIQFMRPGFRTVNYWNGYRWNHETDARGFRNPAAAGHAVLLLGDSLIYGHGVEEEETVAHFLRAEHEVAAYNMGRQGACLLDEYIYLRTFAEELAPKDVVLFVFLNDFHDLEVYRSPEEIAQAPELSYDYRAIRVWASQLAGREPPRVKQWIGTLPSWRLLRSLAKELTGNLSFATPAWAAEAEPLPEFLAPFAADDRLAAIADYYDRVLDDLVPRLRDRGARLHLVYLGADPRLWEEPQNRAFALLEQLASRKKIPAWDTRGLFADCESCFLPRDGHFTAEGHRRLARFLAGRVLAAPAPD